MQLTAVSEVAIFQGGGSMRKEPMPVDRQVGARLRTRRVALGMSQSKLADGLGLTFQQVQKYEKGTNRIGASRLQQISTILDVPVSYFFEGIASDDPPRSEGEQSAIDRFVSSPDGQALIRGFCRIKSGKARRRVVALVEQLSEAK